MNWKDLEEFINTLTEEEKENTVYVDDTNNDCIIALSDSYKLESRLCQNWNGVYDSYEMSEEEFQEELETAFITLEVGTPVLALL